MTAHSRDGAAPQRGGGGSHGGGGRGRGRGGDRGRGCGDPRGQDGGGPAPAGFVHLLAPTPELWTAVLRHRTQILYVADISHVVAELELRPGSVVLEAGTGSGSLTHALARAVAPAGRVASFEFHAARAAEAADELARHGLAGVASVTLRDVEADGFPAAAAAGDAAADGGGGFFVADGAADAVFLDLPGPWRVVPAAARVLRPGGRFCAFSPCVEQVQRTAAALDARGFCDVRTVEVLLRLYDVVGAPPQASVAAGGGGHGGGGDGGGGGGRRKNGDAGRKRARAEEVGGDEAGAAAAAGTAEAGAAAAAAAPAVRAPRKVQCWPQAEARGHTGYLTFATKFVGAAEEGDGGVGGEEEGDEEADDDDFDEDDDEWAGEGEDGDDDG